MKYYPVLSACLLVLGAGCLAPSPASAAPERIAIKSQVHKVKEQSAQTALKTVDVRDIEDPAARKAIREIMNYLNLEYKK